MHGIIQQEVAICCVGLKYILMINRDRRGYMYSNARGEILAREDWGSRSGLLRSFFGWPGDVLALSLVRRTISSELERTRAWEDQRGKKTLLSLTLVSSAYSVRRS